MKFINYAHRGASEYAPENTLLSFCLGIYMGANGIETDVQLTKDGVPVLFHDDSLTRVTGESGRIADYTYAELQQFRVRKGELWDRILSLEDFFQHFGYRELTFAIELKQPDTARATVDLIRAYALEQKVVITSFIWDELCAVRAYAPELETGFLTKVVDDMLLQKMKHESIAELCPPAAQLNAEKVALWHGMGFRVRAWGVKNEALMKSTYDAGADGMTVNFPDKLTEYIRKQ